MIVMIDKDDVYDEMVEKYDDDSWCGAAVASAIAGVFEDCDHGLSDQQIMRKVYDYIQDVMVQSLLEYINNNKKEIVTDILGYCKE